jgi:hypothetical protein
VLECKTWFSKKFFEGQRNWFWKMKEPPKNPWFFSGSFVKTSGSLNFPNDQNWEFFEIWMFSSWKRNRRFFGGLKVSDRRNRRLFSKSDTRFTREET